MSEFAATYSKSDYYRYGNTCCSLGPADEISVHQGTARHPPTQINSYSCFIMFSLFVLNHFLSFQGNVTFSCTEPVSVAMTFSGPHSFLWLPWTVEMSSVALSVGLQFRTWDREGLLLTFDLPKQGGVVWIYLSRARLYIKLHKPGKTQQELSAGQTH